MDKMSVIAMMEAEKRQFVEQWVGKSVKFTDEAVEFFNTKSHRDFCKLYNKPFSDVRAEMVGKVIDAGSVVRTVIVDFGAGAHSWAIDWLERI